MFWKKKKYKPTGRIGIHRTHDYPYYFTVTAEKICEVGNQCRIKILEISKNCDKTDKECLNYIKMRDWVYITSFTWETDAQYNERINRTEPLGAQEIFPRPIDIPIDYTPHQTNPFRHTFVEGQSESTEVDDRHAHLPF